MTPEGWREASVSEAVEVNPRRSLARGTVAPYAEMAAIPREGSQIRYFEPRVFDGGGAKFRNGDTLLARITPCAENGKTALVSGIDAPTAFGSTELIVLGPLEGVSLAEYVFYSVKHEPIRTLLISRMTGTSGRQRIPSSALDEARICLPPLPEQRKIAAILSSVDDAIEATQAVIAQLQVVKKAMMAELLTRGIPGRHKKFKMTEIGEVPEGWEVVRLGDVSTIGNGATPSRQQPDYWIDATIPWLPTGKVNDRVIGVAEEFVSEKALRECPIKLLPKGTILVAMIGQGKTRGKVAYLDLVATINQNFAYVQPTGRVRSWFLFCYLDHQYDSLRASGRGSNQEALNCGILKEYRLPVPPAVEQQQIEDSFRGQENRIQAETLTLGGLTALKSALMSVLLTGEVRVKTDA